VLGVHVGFGARPVRVVHSKRIEQLTHFASGVGKASWLLGGTRRPRIQQWDLRGGESRQSEIYFAALFRLRSGLRLYSSHPFHFFAGVVEEWIAPEVSLYGVRPTARLGAWFSLLPQNGKDGGRCLAERARSKQPKAPYSVLRAFRNVPSPAVNEFFH
jgi:hypothetical protein